MHFQVKMPDNGRKYVQRQASSKQKTAHVFRS